MGRSDRGQHRGAVNMNEKMSEWIGDHYEAIWERLMDKNQEVIEQVILEWLWDRPDEVIRILEIVVEKDGALRDMFQREGEGMYQPGGLEYDERGV
jgi:hypothetical protein